MSSTTRLLVLGVVKLFQPVHGYVVRRELISWRAQEWASVQPGSIYNALKTLTRDGLIEVASTDQVGGRPERTTYRLTTAGTEEFHTLLREEWWNVRTPVDPLMAAVSFLGELPRAEAISALEHRIAQIYGMVRQLEFAIDAHDGSESPLHVREMMRLMNARVAAEIGWSEQFIERLRSREYDTADELPWQPPAKPPSGGARRTESRRRGPRPKQFRTPTARTERRADRRAARGPANESRSSAAGAPGVSARGDRARRRAPSQPAEIDRDASANGHASGRAPPRGDRASHRASSQPGEIDRGALANGRTPGRTQLRGDRAGRRVSSQSAEIDRDALGNDHGPDRAPPRGDRRQMPDKRGKRGKRSKRG